MKTHIALVAVLAVVVVAGCSTGSRRSAHADRAMPGLEHELKFSPETKKAFHPGDSIEIHSITGTAPKFQVGGTYRVIGSCRQQSLKSAVLYLGNTAEHGTDAIVARAGSSLSQPLPNGTTEFDITFTVLRPGQLHVTIYDLENDDQNDNAYAGIYIADAILQR